MRLDACVISEHRNGRDGSNGPGVTLGPSGPSSTVSRRAAESSEPGRVRAKSVEVKHREAKAVGPYEAQLT